MHLREVLSRGESLQVCRPSPSSWGQGGYHTYWLNDTNAWVVPQWQRASQAMVRRVSQGVANHRQRELLDQAGRELLLAQSSDWSFILRAGTTTDLARERIERHLDRFWRLIGAIEKGSIGSGGVVTRTSEARDELPEEWIRAVVQEDALFPLLNAADWAQMGLQQ